MLVRGTLISPINTLPSSLPSPLFYSAPDCVDMLLFIYSPSEKNYRTMGSQYD